MRWIVSVALCALALSGCVDGAFPRHDGAPKPAPIASPVPADRTGARRAEDFDATTEEERAAAAATPAVAAEVSLGVTIASLGDATDQGFWVKTPLVTTTTTGRVAAGNGRSAQVELRPSGGDPTAGSEASLATLRLLEVPLTGLNPLEVFAAP